MRTFEQAIKSRLGLTFPPIPADGTMKVFRVGKDRTGFAIRFDGVGAFGDFASGKYWAWSPDRVVELVMQDRSVERDRAMRRQEIEFEQMVIACARGLIERGEVLCDEDINRYALAIGRLGGLHGRK